MLFRYILGAVCLATLAMIIAYTRRSDSQRYRYGSFAPVRRNGRAAWFIDGKDYMSAVADAIESAKKEIMITDFQMNPEVFMKRSDLGVDSLKWRLDKMLLRKADEGALVHILLYWETKPLPDLGSDHALKLLGKHKNIVIQRHPDHLSGIQNPTTLFR